MAKIDEILDQVKYAKRSTGDIIDDRSLHNIPLMAYVKQYAEYEKVENVLTSFLTTGLTAEEYKTLVIMTLHDRCDKSPTWITNFINHVEKLSAEVREGRLSISDCENVIIDEDVVNILKAEGGHGPTQV